MKGYSPKNIHFIQYPNLDSALRPILHSNQIPVPTFIHLPQIDDEDSASSSDISQDQQEDIDSEFQMSGSSLDRRSPFNQLQCHELVIDLPLPKHSAKMLASRLQKKESSSSRNQGDILSKERRRVIEVFFF